MAWEAMDLCLQVLKESNKSRFDSYKVRNSVLIISHITFRDCRVHIKFFQTTFLEIAVYSTGSSCGFKGYKVVTVLDNCPFITILYFSVALQVNEMYERCICLSSILSLFWILLSFCFNIITTHYHTQKQRNMRFKPRVKFNQNISTVNEKSQKKKIKLVI